MKIDPRVIAELERTGRPWRLVAGSRHIKIVLDGQFVGILPRRPNDRGRAGKNILSQIRRAAAGCAASRRRHGEDCQPQSVSDLAIDSCQHKARTIMKNTFQVASVCYSDYDDSVIATAYLARSVLDPETEISADDTLEVFEIEANFATRTFIIKDLGDLEGESEPHYLPSVLTAFMRAFDVENCSNLFRFEVPL